MSREITLKQLRCLLQVVDAGGFRRAAERLTMTQPSLSAQIQALEAALAVQVLERGRAGTHLTPVGREIAAHARGVLDAADALVDFADRAKPGMVGALKLGVSPSIGPYLLPAAIGELRAAHPGLRLLIGEGAPVELIRRLGEGGYDMIVTQTPVREADLVVEELFREPLFLVVAADHPLATRARIMPDDLTGLEVLSLDARFQLHGQVADLCQTFGARFIDFYDGASLDALRLMVAAGVGVTFLPSLYVRSEVRAGGDVVARRIHGRSILRTMAAVWRRRAGGVSAYRRVAEVLKRVFAELEAGAAGEVIW